MISESRKRAHEKYISNNYDGFSIKIPKELGTKFREAADRNGESIRSILKRAIEKYVEDNCLL